jgi:hypothetical protein
MCLDIGLVDALANIKIAELRREADNERLAQLAIGPGRPIRVRIADWLFAVAERIEGRPRGSIVRAQA